MADKGTREVSMQLQESERQRLRLEEEVKSFESRVGTMRESMAEMVGVISEVGFSGLTLSHSKIRRTSSSWSSVGRNVKRLTISRKP